MFGKVWYNSRLTILSTENITFSNIDGTIEEFPQCQAPWMQLLYKRKASAFSKGYDKYTR